jgi:thymidylate synthase
MIRELRVKDIREAFTELLVENKLTTVGREATMTSLVGSSTVEIVNANFIADEDSIFGTVNWDYVKREEEWYNSMSLNVNDIPGCAPAVWKAVADKDGFINSNYGWCVWSKENFEQYHRARAELNRNPESRRAMMIYTRPSMWNEFDLNGRSDFMCTNAVQYLIRNGAVHAVVQMRSNDSIMGFKNDRAWQQHILESLTKDLNIIRSFSTPAYEVGNLYWNSGSLHVYSRHYFLIDHFSKTGESKISKEAYVSLYPNSPYK